LAWPSSTNRNILESIPYYDCYFIWTKTLIEPLLKSGARRARYLPFGFDTACHRPLGLSDAEKKIYGTDIVFVGNWDNKREQWLEELSDFNLSIWGPWYWWKCCRERRLLKKWKHRVVFAEDLARALSGAKISINILREQNKDNYNMRTFEAPACGAFVLAERSDEARDFFKEDAEAIYFSNPGELREKASYYLAHEDARREIANSGYKRCQEGNHSYFERAKQIIDAYGEIRQSK
jgi:spore maturation protein CgeB